jgi:site-specific DNA recombinase
MKAMSKAGRGPLRFAWLGRVSTDDRQDPTLSLPRQLHTSRAALPEQSAIVAHFYDIESGRKELDERGRGSAHEKFDIPISRDGGIHDLLSEARSPDRRFDAVMCESIERVARRAYFGTKVEHDLERAGVALFAADEPIVIGGKRATTILTRRMKQSVAEWYVLEILEKSWDGLSEHSRQGWNMGVPPYGYTGEKLPHPVPARRAQGATKSRLVPDPVRALIVKQIFTLRVVNRLGYEAIANILNADPQRYPPPESPDPARRRDCWARTSIYEILRNPKYTGYMVWNRRATKSGGGRLNPPEEWVWSPEPTHEAIVTMEMWKAANETGDIRKGSRNGSAPNLRHPLTKRSYLFRSFVICDLCGNRMVGKVMRSYSYYNCEPRKNLGPKARRLLPDHPTSVNLREDALVGHLCDFVSERVFGENRRELLERDVAALELRDTSSQEQAIKGLRKALAKVEERQERQILALERHNDPEGTLLRRITERVRELEAQRAEIEDKLEKLEKESPVEDLGDAGLLDELPILEVPLSKAPPDKLRILFETLRLSVRYNRLTNKALAEVVLELARLEDLKGLFTNALRAPNGIRTRVSTLKG